MWQDILGHDAIVDQFRDTLMRGRLASSYLFVGPEGIGKRTFALKLAEALLCQSYAQREAVAEGVAESKEVSQEFSNQKVSLEPCGRCESCRLALAGNHPDLFEISRPTGKQSLPIELFIGDRAHRNQAGMCHQIAMRPMLGQRRVAIIDDADYLRQESANCLLKTLEEPPPGTLLILIATSRSRQLPTILSRIQIVRFSPLSIENLSQLLPQQQIAPQEVASLAASSDGSLTIAMQYAQGQLAELREQLLPQLTSDRFCSVRLADELGQYVNEAGKEAQFRRQRLQGIIRLVMSHFREQLRASCAVDSDAKRVEGEGVKSDDGSRSAQERALAILQWCIEADQQVERNANQATLLANWLNNLATELKG
jgi:DNA polymerase-3 subunit delta'